MRDFSRDHSALALNTATLGHNVDGFGAGWSAEQVIDGCAARGYGGVVFWRREIGANAAAIGQWARSAGLKIAGLCRSPFLVGPLSPRGREAVLDEFRSSIDMAAALTAPVLTIVVGGVEPGTKGMSESLKIVADRVSVACEYAARAGVKLALEPLNPVYGGDRSCLVTVRDAVDLCDTIGADNLGIAVDVYHVWWDTDLPAQLSRAGARRIYGFHLCDWLADTKDVLLDRGMMGDGVADIRGIRKAVENSGYDGVCEVEIFSKDNWWKRDPNEVLDVLVERFRSVC
ncbi:MULTISPECIES: sugar phosphate isomerase/epimerase family protein [Rhizobium]|uniref:sugar phosphate isomerase/epimerase family protein n=1 Tax=Rhizobium TaxID=379 RepID=UPI001B33F52A|nr:MULTISPECIES: sugar phosphate isomerase/epimerase family protein [Rhizobium]MBX4911053.1 sugar phosphate isomerase/epimerase [Rhizobium bangladeshense]MBX5177190.1 sugar phosphate isomerase/epimerase [Rhizobium lentis]MBX5254003.1 sugar phosphate isomerase/epimerase [Rhizobium sp. NLR4b]MBX5260170.1 sugar phosphate isomerase/epimerase [Rhizobium sp. NLR16b]MBX5266260.1 sugar phosphate isomerase/epimerase [Rhizobium sp. NLR16a]